MEYLPKNQKNILDYLLDKSAGATLNELSAHLGITRTATKEHVLNLEHLGFLFYQDHKGSVGRPKRSYLLSPEGQEVFPKQYSWLSNILLELLAEDFGAQEVTKLMKNLANKVAGSMKERFNNKSSVELLNEIAMAMNELGYRVKLKQTDLRKGAVIEASNCVYHSVAKQHPELCQFDIQFLENVSGLKVKLESCIAKGGATCRFCMKKKSL